MEIIKENCYRQTHYVHKPISLKCKTLSAKLYLKLIPL